MSLVISQLSVKWDRYLILTRVSAGTHTQTDSDPYSASATKRAWLFRNWPEMVFVHPSCLPTARAELLAFSLSFVKPDCSIAYLDISLSTVKGFSPLHFPVLFFIKVLNSEEV